MLRYVGVSSYGLKKSLIGIDSPAKTLGVAPVRQFPQSGQMTLGDIHDSTEISDLSLLIHHNVITV